MSSVAGFVPGFGGNEAGFEVEGPLLELDASAMSVRCVGPGSQ